MGHLPDYKSIVETIPGALSLAECEALARSADFARERALEIGHYHGRSTAVLLESLPAGIPLVTVDHHRGDPWSSGVPVDVFLKHIAPYTGERLMQFVEADMREALTWLPSGFDFVFYDADHSAEGVADFWKLVLPLLARKCTLVFDDADWDEQSTLTALAEADGFVSVRSRDFYRGEKDKRDPETYTLEVMRRS